jgi:hypothetical protein
LVLVKDDEEHAPIESFNEGGGVAHEEGIVQECEPLIMDRRNSECIFEANITQALLDLVSSVIYIFFRVCTLYLINSFYI